MPTPSRARGACGWRSATREPKGVGAQRPDLGYVGQLHARLRIGDPAWRLVNLSRTGARVADVVADQLPGAMELSPTLVTCAVGSNDVLRRTPRPRYERALDELLAVLPVGSVVATLPQGLGRRRAREVNARIVDRRPLEGYGWRIFGRRRARRTAGSSRATASIPMLAATGTGRTRSPRRSGTSSAMRRATSSCARLRQHRTVRARSGTLLRRARPTRHPTIRGRVVVPLVGDQPYVLGPRTYRPDARRRRERRSVARRGALRRARSGHYALTGSVDEAPPLLPACERPFTRRCRGFSELKRTDRVPLDLPLLAS